MHAARLPQNHTLAASCVFSRRSSAIWSTLPKETAGNKSVAPANVASKEPRKDMLAQKCDRRHVIGREKEINGGHCSMETLGIQTHTSSWPWWAISNFRAASGGQIRISNSLRRVVGGCCDGRVAAAMVTSVKARPPRRPRRHDDRDDRIGDDCVSNDLQYPCRHMCVSAASSDPARASVAGRSPLAAALL